MNKIIGLLAIFILLILQIAFVPHLTIFGVYPNVLLAAILVFATMRSGRWVFLFAFLSGIALDIFSSRAFGLYTFSFILLVWLIEYVGKNTFKATDLSGQISILALSCVFFSALVFFLIKIFYWFNLGQNISFWGELLKVGSVEIMLNFVLAGLALMIFKKSHGLLAAI
jgi:rod shape-determining protein MreD